MLAEKRRHHYQCKVHLISSYWQKFLLFSLPYTFYADLEARYLKGQPGGIAQIKKDTLLWISNQCWALNYPRPLLPNVVTAGGILTAPAKPLPQVCTNLKRDIKIGVHQPWQFTTDGMIRNYARKYCNVQNHAFLY